MPLVWISPAHQVKAEWQGILTLGVLADATHDDNYNILYYIKGGADASMFEWTEHGLTVKEEYTTNWKGFESYLGGDNKLEVTIEAVHRIPSWDGPQFDLITKSEQTFTLEIQDVKPHVFAQWDRVHAEENYKTGDAVQTQYGTDWTFNINSVGDGTGEPVVTMEDDAGGRFKLERVGDIFTVRVKDASKLDYNGQDYVTIKIGVFDGTTKVIGEYDVALWNSAPSKPVDKVGPSGATLDEHTSAGVGVGVTMSATDPQGGAVTYSFQSDYYWAQYAFKINPKTGVITVADSSL
ncbi:MAG: cadherin repeat domain-containing protein, partial [Alphaproteobacteria bacterium]